VHPNLLEVSRWLIPGSAKRSSRHLHQSCCLAAASRSLKYPTNLALAAWTAQTDLRAYGCGALLAAGQVFHATPERTNVLVIFSDMRQDATGFSLEGLSRSSIEPILTRVEAEQRIPDLKGIRVAVLGAILRVRAGLLARCTRILE
jgi:hypothetical protein